MYQGSGKGSEGQRSNQSGAAYLQEPFPSTLVLVSLTLLCPAEKYKKEDTECVLKAREESDPDPGGSQHYTSF